MNSLALSLSNRKRLLQPRLPFASPPGVVGVNAAESGAVLNLLAGFHQSIDANMRIDGGVFYQTARAHVAHNFTHNAGIADADNSSPPRYDIHDNARLHLGFKLAMIGIEVRALRLQQFLPFAQGASGFELGLGAFPSGAELGLGSRLSEKIRGAFENEVSDVVWSAALQAFDASLTSSQLPAERPSGVFMLVNNARVLTWQALPSLTMESASAAACSRVGMKAAAPNFTSRMSACNPSASFLERMLAVMSGMLGTVAVTSRSAYNF